jgi:beta-lactamase regulating signal transducer with metallopeptidase domain/5-hydroxyisourate hydrolase-like protein (transthyretin family)
MPGPFDCMLGWLALGGVQAAVLAALVLLVITIGRGRLEPRWAFGLWALVLVRLALPVAPPAPWGVLRIEHPPVVRDSEPLLDGPAGEIAPAAIEPVREVEPPVAEPSGSPIETPTGPPETLASEPPVAINWRIGLVVAWLAGTFLLLARQIVLHIRLIRERREWADVDDPAVRELFNRCRIEFGVRRPVRLVAAHDHVGPATDGVFRSRIVLSAELLARLAPAELRLVFLHELAHVRRWDVLIDRLATLVASIHWFNPAGWVALAGLRNARELACDAQVLRRVGPMDAGGYGHALLAIATGPIRRSPATVGALSSRNLDRRIRMIAGYQPPSAARQALGVFVFTLLAVFGLTDAVGRSSPPPKDQPAKGAPAATTAVSGVVNDEAGKPLTGVRVILYRDGNYDGSREKVAEVETKADGRFTFPDAPAHDTGHTLAVVATKAGRGSFLSNLTREVRQKPITVTMSPAATLSGRVTDEAGKPIAGVRVWNSYLAAGPLDGVHSAVTDADGRYALHDMARWKPFGEGRITIEGGCFFDVRHPDYGHERPLFYRMPDTVDVVLRPAGIVEGKLIDKLTGKPAAGAIMSLQGLKDVPAYEQTRTGPDGKFRFVSLKAGQYNLWGDYPDRACAAIEALTVEPGKTVSNQNLELVDGGWVEGQIVDAATGAAIGSTPDRPLTIFFYGPARPKLGAGCQAAKVDVEGRFRHRVPPGKQFFYIAESGYQERVQRHEFFAAGIDVKADEIVRVTLRLLPAKPLPDPDPTPVRLAIPVPAEREAAARVRELGGWYQVDADGHVVEVNMASHSVGKQGIQNPRKDTDGGLRAAAGFPRLRRFIGTRGQVTDEGLRALRGLTDLELLWVSEGNAVTDAGVAHLTGLTKLKRVHLSGSRLTDASLAVLAGLPALEELGIGNNVFTDDGLKQLAGLTNLRRLYLGMNQKPLTEAGIRHLAGLTKLTRLDLQMVPLTDAAVANLKDMKEMQSLWIGNDTDPLTDASINVLTGMSKLRDLGVRGSKFSSEGIERLLKLPELKELRVGSSAIPEARQAELSKDKRLHLSDSGPK